jgi:hypothetical protein
LALIDPTADTSDSIMYQVTGVPADWILNAGTKNVDGSWTIQTNDPSALTVTTPSNYVGASVLTVNSSWINADGSAGSLIIPVNVEAYAPGSPIFAWSGDDTLTGSSANDLFVFSQPIASDVIHNFDVTADKIDLIGFVGVNSFADLQSHIVNDANGNAVVTLANGETIKIMSVDAATLSSSNFVFNQEPVTNNAGTMTISDGALLPLSGVVNNSGSIVLNSSGTSTSLEVLVENVRLQGGGQLTLSDNSNNVIFGGTTSATLINIDNVISGAGQLGNGQMTLVNSGTILANGVNALIVDTGSNVITNNGTLEATGSGGLAFYSDILNTGELWANGGNIAVHGAVSGLGSATFDGVSSIEFDGASSASVTLNATATGTLILDNFASFTGTVAGINSDDKLDLKDFVFTGGTSTSFTANLDNTGGTLIINNGTQTANVELVGIYVASDFHVNADISGGTVVTYGV